MTVVCQKCKTFETVDVNGRNIFNRYMEKLFSNFKEEVHGSRNKGEKLKKWYQQQSG